MYIVLITILLTFMKRSRSYKIIELASQKILEAEVGSTKVPFNCQNTNLFCYRKEVTSTEITTIHFKKINEKTGKIENFVLKNKNDDNPFEIKKIIYIACKETSTTQKLDCVFQKNSISNEDKKIFSVKISTEKFSLESPPEETFSLSHKPIPKPNLIHAENFYFYVKEENKIYIPNKKISIKKEANSGSCIPYKSQNILICQHLTDETEEKNPKKNFIYLRDPHSLHLFDVIHLGFECLEIGYFTNFLCLTKSELYSFRFMKSVGNKKIELEVHQVIQLPKKTLNFLKISKSFFMIARKTEDEKSTIFDFYWRLSRYFEIAYSVKMVNEVFDDFEIKENFVEFYKLGKSEYSIMTGFYTSEGFRPCEIPKFDNEIHLESCLVCNKIFFDGKNSEGGCQFKKEFECPKGYFFNGRYCKENPINCLEASIHEYNCLRCNLGLNLERGICYQGCLEKGIHFFYDGICKKANLGSKIENYDFTITHSECLEGNKFSELFCYKEAVECPDNEFFVKEIGNSNTGSCQSEYPGCQKNINFGCDVCKTGFTYNQESVDCRKNCVGEELVKFSEKKRDNCNAVNLEIPNCSKAESLRYRNYCYECNEGFELTNLGEKCVKIQEEDFIKDKENVVLIDEGGNQKIVGCGCQNCFNFTQDLRCKICRIDSVTSLPLLNIEGKCKNREDKNFFQQDSNFTYYLKKFQNCPLNCSNSCNSTECITDNRFADHSLERRECIKREGYCFRVILKDRKSGQKINNITEISPFQEKFNITFLNKTELKSDLYLEEGKLILNVMFTNHSDLEYNISIVIIPELILKSGDNQTRYFLKNETFKIFFQERCHSSCKNCTDLTRYGCTECKEGYESDSFIGENFFNFCLKKENKIFIQEKYFSETDKGVIFIFNEKINPEFLMKKIEKYSKENEKLFESSLTKTKNQEKINFTLEENFPSITHFERGITFKFTQLPLEANNVELIFNSKPKLPLLLKSKENQEEAFYQENIFKLENFSFFVRKGMENFLTGIFKPIFLIIKTVSFIILLIQGPSPNFAVFFKSLQMSRIFLLADIHLPNNLILFLDHFAMEPIEILPNLLKKFSEENCRNMPLIYLKRQIHCQVFSSLGHKFQYLIVILMILILASLLKKMNFFKKLKKKMSPLFYLTILESMQLDLIMTSLISSIYTKSDSSVSGINLLVSSILFISVLLYFGLLLRIRSKEIILKGDEKIKKNGGYFSSNMRMILLSSEVLISLVMVIFASNGTIQIITLLLVFLYMSSEFFHLKKVYLDSKQNLSLGVYFLGESAKLVILTSMKFFENDFEMKTKYDFFGNLFIIIGIVGFFIQFGILILKFRKKEKIEVKKKQENEVESNLENKMDNIRPEERVDNEIVNESSFKHLIIEDNTPENDLESPPNELRFDSITSAQREEIIRNCARPLPKISNLRKKRRRKKKKQGNENEKLRRGKRNTRTGKIMRNGNNDFWDFSNK